MKILIGTTPLLVALTAALSGCGVSPGPNLSGPNGASYLSAYSGDWVLLRLESDDLDAEVRGAGPARRPVATGNMPGGRAGGRSGGMTGGRPTGGVAGGGRGPGGGEPGGGGRQVDPVEMARIMRTNLFLARTPTEFTLRLDPESATFTQPESGAVVMLLGGDETAVLRESMEYFAAAEWTDEGLVIERKVDKGGRVKDKLRVDAEGYLVVQREIDLGRGKVEGVLKYKRAGG